MSRPAAGASRLARYLSAALIALPLVHATRAADATRVDSPASLVAPALAALDDSRQDEAWFFTMTLVEGEEQRVVQHNPTIEPLAQRTLVSVDGEAPDAGRLQAFREEERKRVEERDPGTARYGYLVDVDTLQLVATRDGVREYRFAPRLARMEEVQDKMRGTLLLNTGSGAIDKIEISNAEAFSPAFSVKLREYRLTFLFRDEAGTRLLARMESRAAGKAGFLKSFDSSVDIDFSAYRPAGKVR